MKEYRICMPLTVEEVMSNKQLINVTNHNINVSFKHKTNHCLVCRLIALRQSNKIVLITVITMFINLLIYIFPFNAYLQTFLCLHYLRKYVLCAKLSLVLNNAIYR